MKHVFSGVVAVGAALAAASAVAGINGGGSAKVVEADQPVLTVIGPVEAYNPKNHSARVLGQTVILQHAAEIAVGDTVSVVGTTGVDGVISATVVKDQGVYVPGSTTVFLSGRIQKVNKSVGTATVNGVTVDFTALLMTDSVAPAVGSEVQIGGTQPALGGVVLANGINGGGMSTAGINGGGVALATGINGGGLATSGINGGGVALATGINGGGLATSGINGGGVALATGINGGGLATSGINGGGVALATGINGGGLATSGINGGGVALATGINGGGLTTSGINGGGE